MLYRRMRIEVESPEEMGYGRIRNNLSESSITDCTLGDFTVDLSGLLLPYGEHRGEPRLRDLIAANTAAAVKKASAMLSPVNMRKMLAIEMPMTPAKTK